MSSRSRYDRRCKATGSVEVRYYSQERTAGVNTYLHGSKSIETIIVSGSTVGEIERGAGIMEAVGINDVVVDGYSSLIKMSMTIDINIYPICVEEILKRCLACLKKTSKSAHFFEIVYKQIYIYVF